MIHEENRRSRRVVVRVGRGESLRDAIQSAARDRAVTTAVVTAQGVIARATLDVRVPMRGVSAPRTVEGPLELLSLVGDVASHEGVLHFDGTVTLARHEDHGIVVLGGHLVDAEAEGVTVVLDTLDDLGLRREAERPTGLLGFRAGPGAVSAKVESVARSVPTPSAAAELRGPAPSAPSASAPALAARPVAAAQSVRRDAPSAEPALPSAWAAVVAASSGAAAPAGGLGDRAASAALEPALLEAARAGAPVVDPIGDRGGMKDDEPMPVVGDWVDHRQFGLCRVDRASADGELLIKLDSGRRKEIRLDFLEVLPPRRDGARRIFPLRPRKA